VDLRTLSLCSGVGGIDLGLRIAHPGARTVCYVEREAFCASVLAARMDDGSLDQAPVWDDVTTFDGRPWRGAVDLVAAGFPCQPVSIAGKRLGMDDKRFIWDDIARIIGEVEPRYVFLENVPGILTADGGAFLDRVLSSLVVLGFDCEWDVFSAEETGAPHRRQRWFCLAVSMAYAEVTGARANESGIRRGFGECSVYPPARSDRAGWAAVSPDLAPAVEASPQSQIRGDADGLDTGLDPALFAYRQDRLRAVGNGVVPLSCAVAWVELNERMERHEP
jgi:DNA (cytosine-5)-methyltransferase 1